MIRLLFILSLAFGSLGLNAQNMTPEQIVQKQLDTYNQRDIEGFMALFSPDVTLYNQGDPKPIASGFDEVKKLYTRLFDQSPTLHSTLTNRIVLGQTVIDHESITGRMGKAEAIELVVIYEVKSQKIWRVTVIRP